MISDRENNFTKINFKGYKSPSLSILDKKLKKILLKLKVLSQEPIVPLLDGKKLRKWFKSVETAIDGVCDGVYDQ